ncbi:MAG: acetyl-CoA C-acetyltransferase [Chloroflexi bacterium]|nr:acetyl-CoA C-acetyltransferase [Chloroflexota bacterium]
MRDVVIVSAARTPMGKLGGQLSELSATSLGSAAISGAIDRSGIEPGELDYGYVGNMLSAGLGQTPARQAMIGAGVPEGVSGMTINKACASGLASVVLAAQTIQAGDAEAVVAGGMESMSNAPHMLMNSRTGLRMGDSKLTDHMINDGLWCPFENRHMGDSAEAIAQKYEVEREAQDEYAVRSQIRASSAVESGIFDEEIIPIYVPQRRGDPVRVTKDEGPRSNASMDRLGALIPAFQLGDTVTAGNSSGIADGAAACVVMSGERATEKGITPLARITGYAHEGNAPGMLFDAPSAAVARLLERTGQSLDDFDLIEANEAFAAQVLANGVALNWDLERVNVWGGAIALGHPIGASGGRILTTLLYGLRRVSGKHGLAVICHAGGGAVALSVENLN